jgi:hypothetical protein
VASTLLATWGCGQDKSVTFARLLERAASWGSAVEFAQQLAQDGQVPRRYVEDLMATASQELTTLAAQIDSSEGVDPDSKQQASEACAGLAILTGDAARAHGTPAQSALRELEFQLRETARLSRAVPPKDDLRDVVP